MSLWSWLSNTAKKAGKAVGSAVSSVGKVVGSVAKSVGKVVSTIASPVVSAVEYIGEKTGLDKPIKAIAGGIAKGVRQVGSAIEHSGVVGQALANAYNITKVVNPLSYGIDAGLGANDVIQGKTSVGDALVGVGLSKVKKLKGVLKIARTAQGVNYARTHPLN